MKKLIIILGVAGTSLSAIFVRWSDAPSMVLVLYRVCFATLFLLPFFVVELRRHMRSISKKYFLLSAASGMFLAFHFTAYFQSLRYTSIASSVVLVDTEIFFIALATFILFKENLSKKRWIGILIAFLGSAVIAFSDAGGGSNVLLGDALALLGAGCLAVYTMIGVYCRRQMTTTIYTFTVYAFASLTLLLILSVQRVNMVGYSTVNILSGIGLALFCTLLGHSLFSWGLKFEKAAYVSASKMLEPVFATILGIIFFCEIPSVFVIAGGGLVVGGIVYYTLQNT